MSNIIKFEPVARRGNWPQYLCRAHDLMLARKSTREMAAELNVSLATAANYRNRVNRRVGDRPEDRPWIVPTPSANLSNRGRE